MTTIFGGYEASRHADGTLTIHRVPIFVECERNSIAFDANWLATAVAKAKQAEAEGYLPPLHVRHHEDGPGFDQVKAAGYFRVLGAEPITFKGSQRLAIFADLVVTDPAVAGDVLAKRLPYRSVEIFDVEKPAIDSLALLDHEAPYLELPMLMVSDVRDRGSQQFPGQSGLSAFARATFKNPWLSGAEQSDSPVLACFRRGASAHLFYTDPNKEKTMADSQPKPEEKKMQDGPALDVGALVKAIESGTISVADMDSILAAIQKQRGAAAEVEVEAPEAAPAPAPGQMGEAMAKGTMDVEMARLRGELDAQRARLNERDAQDKRREDVGVAMKLLDGRPLGADLESKLVAFHRDHGAAAFAAYVESMAQTFGALSSSDDQALAAFSSQAAKMPETAMPWQAHGVEAMEKAANFSKEWTDLTARGVTRMSEARYVEVNMERLGFKAQRN